MQRTKKELYEENKKLKEVKKSYEYFWEDSRSKELEKQINIATIILYILALIFLCLAFFLGGMII